jgi:hypothetical protein
MGQTYIEEKGTHHNFYSHKICKVNAFGIQVPMTVAEALAIDKAANTTFWHDAIKKAMKNVMIAFRFLDPNAKSPFGFKWIRCHMIFVVKMDFTHKARFVVGGHMTNPPTSLTYCCF